MADKHCIIALEVVRGIGEGEIARLPYGMFEVTACGLVLDYIPRSSKSSEETPRLNGVNIFDDELLGNLLKELRPLLEGLTSSSGCSERRLLSLPFSDKTVRFAVVASAVRTRHCARISLVRLPDLPPTTFAITRTLSQ